jgi:hypothetical protein
MQGSSYFRPLGAETALFTSADSGDNVSLAQNVRIVNSHATAAYKVSLQDHLGALQGEMTICAGESVILNKKKNEELFAANVAVLVAPVAR